MIYIPIFTILIMIGLSIIISTNYNFNRLLLAIGSITTIPIIMFYYIDSLKNHSLSAIIANIYQEDTTFIFSLATGISVTVAMLYALLYKKINFKENGMAFIYVSLTIAIYCTDNFHTILVLVEAVPILAIFMIAISPHENSRAIAIQYLLIHIFSSLLLALGIDFYLHYTSSVNLQNIANFNHFSKYLILAALLINLGVFPLSSWLIDSVTTVSSQVSIFFIMFTSKLALFILLNTFLGYHFLLYVGILMVVYSFIFSLLTSNLRKILTYSSLQFTGIILIAMSVKNPSIQGINALIFTSILYETALFIMSGMLTTYFKHDSLYKMQGIFHNKHFIGIPLLIISLNIIGFPLTGGFIGQSLILNTLNNSNNYLYYFMLFSIACFSLNAGFKLPFILYIKKPKLENITYFKKAKINYSGIVPILLLLAIIEITYVIYSYFNMGINNLKDTYFALKILLISTVLFIIAIKFLNKSSESKIYKLPSIITQYSYLALQFATITTNKKYDAGLNYSLRIISLLISHVYKLNKLYYNSRLVYIALVSLVVLGIIFVVI